MEVQLPVAIIDLGGQYTHMIKRRLRDMGVSAEVKANDMRPDEFGRYSGFILSGGPQSVYDTTAPKVSPELINANKPILGICYGHQLLARLLGSEVQKGISEFGPATLRLKHDGALFGDMPQTQTVWMSHQDTVGDLPKGFEVLASTDRCAVAAYGNAERRLYGIQFHPEVSHSEHGQQLLKNFVRDVCKVRGKISLEASIELQLDTIRRQALGRSVFFFVSGGVDSMVAFSMCARALGEDRVLGVYIDTGLMRAGEREDLERLAAKAGLADRLVVKNEATRFLTALEGQVEPELKRQTIGRCFVEVQSEAFRDFGVHGGEWMLGQGTIYPDTVESGGTSQHTAKIKTHHNRCIEVVELLEAGLVVEPLADFYKDEVRKIGRKLGLDEEIVARWPFPGPGLAIRCLGSTSSSRTRGAVSLPSGFKGFQAFQFPVSSVGVQGDFRTYRDALAVVGELDYGRLDDLAGVIYAHYENYNRIIFHLAGNRPIDGFTVEKSELNAVRLARLRAADAVVTNMMRGAGAYNQVWQFPVVMAPVSTGAGGETIILRPVNSVDGMTANYAHLEGGLLRSIAHAVCQIEGIDAVYLDVSDKPPATIEWE